MSVSMKPNPALRVIEPLSGVGYFFVIASIIYFIVGSIVGLVHGDMLELTFCGSIHHIGGPEWCGYEPHMGWEWGDLFIHRLINAAIPWVMMVFGLFLLAVCLPLMQMLGYKNNKRLNRD